MNGPIRLGKSEIFVINECLYMGAFCFISGMGGGAASQMKENVSFGRVKCG